MLPVVSPAVLRWVIGSIGSILSAVAVAMAGEVSTTMILAAAGGALIGSLKTLPDTVRLGDLPRGFIEYLESVRRDTVPPEPALTPSTPVAADVDQ